ncbi:DUF2515 family protein, partial [Acinetobacter baumannii]|uniref:DUF2515 family protein n=1 Tax=Acinetobacter baumannii TaxID=470 RepID=UPI00387E1AE9
MGSCAAPSAKGDDKFITTDYLQQCPIAEDYDSRMKWIGKAAEKYHRLMLDEKGRPFLQQELKTISKWGNSKADFKIHSSSNEGKV